MIATVNQVNLMRSLLEFWGDLASGNWPVVFPDTQQELSQAEAWMELHVPLLREETHREKGLTRVRLTFDVHCFASPSAAYGESLRMVAAVQERLKEMVVIRDFEQPALPAVGVLRFREPTVRQFARQADSPELRKLSHVLISAEGVAELPAT